MFNNLLKKINTKYTRKEENRFFLIIILAFTVFMGAYIPLDVLSFNPMDFSINNSNPINIIFVSLIFYILIGSIIYISYIFIGGRFRNILMVFFVAYTLFAILNYHLHGYEFDIINQFLVNDGFTNYEYEIQEYIKNLILFLGIVIISFFVLKFPLLYKNLFIIILISMFAYIGILAYDLVDFVGSHKFVDTRTIEEDDIKPIYTLSKNNKNVIVFMIDRFAGGYFNKVIEMFPEYKDSFEGFTFYNNTLSFGYQTTTGSPGLFGGYEYTPMESDKRDENIVDKHNESITMMPKIFGENDYDVVVSNPPDVNYWDSSRTNPFKGLKNVKYKSYKNKIKADVIKDNTNQALITQYLNFIQYSIMTTVPIVFKKLVYNDGFYIFKSNNLHAYTDSFINNYVLLNMMKKMTTAENTEKPQVVILTNNLTHESSYLSYPDFELTHKHEEFADQTKINLNGINSNTTTENNEMIYSCYHYFDTCVYAIKQITRWINYLKEIGVYDNTRIIIASDHGTFLDNKIKEFRFYEDKDAKFHGPIIYDFFNPLMYNPILLVKDFDDRSEFKISSEFMTNADVPTIAMKDLIDNPINPYTKNSINSDYKNRNKFYVAYSVIPWQPTYHTDDNKHETLNRIFLSLKGKNIFDIDKWEAIVGFKGPVCDVHSLVKQYKPEKEMCGVNNICDYYKCSECGLLFLDSEASSPVAPDEVMKDIPCVYTNYVSNRDGSYMHHGTMTAICDRCRMTKNTIYEQDNVSNHIASTSYIFNKATIHNDGFAGNICNYCFKRVSTESVIKRIDKIELEYDDTIYDGKYKKPEIKAVYDIDGNIIPDANYVKRYHSNIFPGIANLNVVFRENYEGEVPLDFTIRPANLVFKKYNIDKNKLELQFGKSKCKIHGVEIECNFNSEDNIIKYEEKLKSDNKVIIRDIENIKELDYIRYRTFVNSKEDDEIKIYSDWSEEINVKGKK